MRLTMDSPPGRSSSRDALLSLDTSFPELPLLRKPDLPSAHEAHEPVHKFESFSQTDIDNSGCLHCASNLVVTQQRTISGSESMGNQEVTLPRPPY